MFIDKSLTELTAHVLSSFVTGCTPFTVTMQAPQPPSEHINLVPLNWAFVLMNVFKLVSMGTVDALTVKKNVRN